MVCVNAGRLFPGPINVQTAQPSSVNTYNKPRQPAHAAIIASQWELAGVRGFRKRARQKGNRIIFNSFPDTTYRYKDWVTSVFKQPVPLFGLYTPMHSWTKRQYSAGGRSRLQHCQRFRTLHDSRHWTAMSDLLGTQVASWRQRRRQARRIISVTFFRKTRLKTISVLDVLGVNFRVAG